MDTTTRAQYENLSSTDGDLRYQAYNFIMEATSQPVDWAYEVWVDLLARLSHPDGHQRSIATQVLCRLAKSDPESRMLQDFDALMAVTRDAKFVTARHTLQAAWQVGAAGEAQQKLVVDRLSARFHDCASEKNYTLIRFDIVEGLRKLYDVVQDETLRAAALALIESEADGKYRKKYAGVWRTA